MTSYSIFTSLLVITSYWYFVLLIIIFMFLFFSWSYFQPGGWESRLPVCTVASMWWFLFCSLAVGIKGTSRFEILEIALWFGEWITVKLHYWMFISSSHIIFDCISTKWLACLAWNVVCKVCEVPFHCLKKRNSTLYFTSMAVFVTNEFTASLMYHYFWSLTCHEC